MRFGFWRSDGCGVRFAAPSSQQPATSSQQPAAVALRRCVSVSLCRCGVVPLVLRRSWWPLVGGQVSATIFHFPKECPRLSFDATRDIGFRFVPKIGHRRAVSGARPLVVLCVVSWFSRGCPALHCLALPCHAVFALLCFALICPSSPCRA